MSDAPSLARVAAVACGGFGGLVLLALGIGTAAAMLGPPDRVFLTTAIATTAGAVVAGILAPSLLRQLLARPRHDDAGYGLPPDRRR